MRLSRTTMGVLALTAGVLPALALTPAQGQVKDVVESGDTVSLEVESVSEQPGEGARSAASNSAPGLVKLEQAIGSPGVTPRHLRLSGRAAELCNYNATCEPWDGEHPCNCADCTGGELVSMGTIRDECGEGGSNLCRFIAHLEDEVFTITNEYSVDVNETLPLTDHVYFKIECPDNDCGNGESIFEWHVDSEPEGKRYSVDFVHMAQFPAPGQAAEAGTYTITASAHLNHDNDPTIESEEEAETEQQGCYQLNTTNEDFDIQPPPLWYELSVFGLGNYVGHVDAHPYVIWADDDREYTFRGRVPHNPSLYRERFRHSDTWTKVELRRCEGRCD